MKKVICTHLIAASFLSCSSYHVENTADVDSNIKPTNGVFYSLPKKVFKLKIKYKTISGVPSKYAISENFLKIVKPLAHDFQFINDSITRYTISEIDLISESVSDSNTIYFVELLGRNNPVLKKKVGFGLSESGILINGKGGYENQSVKYGAKIAETVINLATGAVPLSESAAQTEDSLIEQYDSELNDIVTKIVSLRNRRYDLLTTDYPINKKSSLFDQIDKRENHLLKLIQGKKTTSEKVKTVYISTIHVGSFDVFKFSKEKGFKEESKGYNLNVSKLSPSSSQEQVITQLENGKKKKGIHYRIPAVCNLAITNTANDTVLNRQESIPQLGLISWLPNRAGVFQSTIDFKLDSETGALLEYSGSSEEIDNEVVNELSSSIISGAQSSNKFKEEEERIKELELEIRLRELELKKDSLNSN